MNQASLLTALHLFSEFVSFENKGYKEESAESICVAQAVGCVHVHVCEQGRLWEELLRRRVKHTAQDSLSVNLASYFRPGTNVLGWQHARSVAHNVTYTCAPDQLKTHVVTQLIQLTAPEGLEVESLPRDSCGHHTWPGIFCLSAF